MEKRSIKKKKKIKAIKKTTKIIKIEIETLKIKSS